MKKKTFGPAVIVSAFGLLAAACGGTETEAEAPSEPVLEPVVEEQAEAAELAADTAEQPPAPASAAAEEGGLDVLLRRGQLMFLRCRSCHSLEISGPHKTGPNLHGLFGATAGQKEGFVYSDALANSGVVWDEETLDAFVTRPTSFVPGNKMVFAGLPRAEDREALIAYLKEETQ